MITTGHTMTKTIAARLAFAGAALLLAIDPLLWLAETWRDPSYGSDGVWVFAIIIGLFVWSVSSRKQAGSKSHTDTAITLLAISGAVRMAGQILAINTISALTLVIDVYALALLFGTASRIRAVSPFWLAIGFAFSLPLERIVQRTAGYGLQRLAADGACAVLGTVFEDTICEGVRIVLNGQDVLVDLPCSGARAILLLALGFTVVAAICRPNLHQTLTGAMVVLAAALASNMVRITVLAIGIAHPDWFWGADVMAEPWHDLIGLTTLGLGTVPLIAWGRTIYQPRRARCRTFDIPLGSVPDRVRKEGWWLETQQRSAMMTLPGGLALLLAAVLITSLPRTPVDVARKEKPITLPLWIEGRAAEPIELSAQEKDYFTQFGGTAAKARYGNHTLMVIRTSSPLRHLHAPDECLRGLGFDVDYLGASFEPVPTAVYRATAPDGTAFRIDVSFVSERGTITTNVATAVWRWLHHGERIWTAVQRISPETVPESEHRAWGQAIAAALDLPTQAAFPRAAANIASR